MKLLDAMKKDFNKYSYNRPAYVVQVKELLDKFSLKGSNRLMVNASPVYVVGSGQIKSDQVSRTKSDQRYRLVMLSMLPSGSLNQATFMSSAT